MSACGYLPYIAFVAIGSLATSKAKDIGMESGSYVGLVIYFSVAFFVLSLVAQIADLMLRRNSPAYNEAIEENLQAKLARKENKRRIIAERRAKATPILAREGIAQPTEVTRPNRKLLLYIWLNFKMVKAIGFFIASIALISLVFLTLFQLYGYIDVRYVFKWDEESFTVITLSVSCGVICAFAFITILLFKRISIYNKKNSLKIIRKLKLRQFGVIVGICLGVMASCVGIWFILFAGIEALFIIMVGIIFIIPFAINRVLGLKIKRVFNITKKNEYNYYTTLNGEEVPLTIELFCKQRNLYKDYCNDMRYYNYNVKRCLINKPTISKNKYTHQRRCVKLIISLCIIFVVAVVFLIGIVIDSQNIFKVGVIYQVSDGMSKSDVAEILGKPTVDDDLVWTYYSSNYVKKLNEIEDLNKQMANVESFEQAINLQEQIDNVKKEMQTMTYKYIIVTFDENDRVKYIDYDLNYNPSKNAEAQLSLGILNCYSTYCEYGLTKYYGA